jgi:fatty acid-binding protein DegV
LPDYRYSIGGQITPALVVHTGPGLIGIGIQRLA